MNMTSTHCFSLQKLQLWSSTKIQPLTSPSSNTLSPAQAPFRATLPWRQKAMPLTREDVRSGEKLLICAYLWHLCVYYMLKYDVNYVFKYKISQSKYVAFLQLVEYVFCFHSSSKPKKQKHWPCRIVKRSHLLTCFKTQGPFSAKRASCDEHPGPPESHITSGAEDGFLAIRQP